MRIQQISAALIVGVFVATAVPGAAFAATASSGGVSASSTKLCEKRKVLIDGALNDFNLFEKQYYTVPTGADLEQYPIVKIVDLEGNNPQVRSSVGNVTVYKDGKPKKVKRVNYGLVLQRHQGALAAAKKKPGVDTAAYEKSINKLQARISGDNLVAIRTEWLSAKNQIGGGACNTKAGQMKAKNLVKKRADLLRKLNAQLPAVKKASSEASVAYKAVAKAYKKAR